MRGHKMLTQELLKELPALYSQDGKGYDAIAYVHYFSMNGWHWYGTEFDGDDTFFGLVRGLETELGYFSLRELESLEGRIAGTLPIPIKLVERDLHWEPKPLREIA